QIVVIPISDESTQDSLRPLKEELKSLSGVLSVAASSHVPGQTTYYNPFIPEGYSPDQSQYMGELAVDADFIPTLGIEMASGRNFSPDLESDIDRSVIINETAARKFGWEDAIGKSITEFTKSGKMNKKTVIGVVKDFHIESLHKEIAPLHISCSNDYLNSLSIRISPENIPETMALLRDKIRQFAPHQPFTYTFLDDSFDSQYRAEERLSRIFTYFSVLAIFIACLGLFGLASFTAEQRTKEIGIRRVLGASVTGILILLTREFTKWVVISNIIAWPLAYFALNKWLQGFAYRTHISVTVFVFSLAISFLIALLTVSSQALRAATTDPIKSLRYE
ncbi:MAG: ABC transporter permease, partial [Candidatus Aminicenantes bacterium]|nr:ABC transporter permease [Candidatus Aminicenantes bacterium]